MPDTAPVRCPAEPPRGGFAYRPALDGVRAVAVAAVVVFHGGLAFLPGGFLGVDAFFVLSGFLITSLLLAERAGTGRIRLRAFWARRARRLLPALLVVLAAVVVAGRFLLAPGDLGPLRGDGLAALLYVANWRMIFRGGDYFAQTAAPSPLQHTWSLGIEEQFYLLWPLVVVALRARRRLLLAVCAAGGVASMVLAALRYRPFDVNRAYYGTDTRAVALLVGCALAALLADRAGRQTDQAGGRWRWRVRHPVLGGLALVGAGVLVLVGTTASGTSAWLYRGGFGVVALAVAAVLAHAVVSPGSPTARLLGLAPLRWLGRLSYGVYLWHWPVFVLLTAERGGLRGLPLFGARCAVTLALAVASYHLVEKPIRTGHLLPRYRPPVTPVAAAAAGVAGAGGAVGAGGAAGGGGAGRVGRRPVVLRRAAAPAVALGAMGVVAGMIIVLAAPGVPGAGSAGVPAAAGKPGGRPVVVHSASPEPVAPVNRAGRRPGVEPRVTFFGDSVSWTLGTYLPPHPGLSVTVRSIEGCGIATLPDILELGGPHTNYPGCTGWPSRWRAGVAADDPDVSVILLDRWELMDRRLGGGYQHVGQPGYDAYLTGQLAAAIGIAGSRGARVVLLTAPYTHRAERPDGGLYPEDQPQRVDAWNALLYAAEARDPARVSVLDLNRLVCPGGHFTWTIDGLQIRSDGLHFTPAGDQRIIAPWLLPQLAALARA